MEKSQIRNIVKIREDRVPITLLQSEHDGMFSLEDKLASSSWIPINKEDISLSDLRNGIEPWLTSLFQSEHMSLLTGSGLSIAVQYLASRATSSAMDQPELNSKYAGEIRKKANLVAEKGSRGRANIEDYIRVINELILGFEVLGYDLEKDTENRIEYDRIKEEFQRVLGGFVDDISNIENSIAIASEPNRQEAFEYLVSFLTSFASRVGTRDRLNIFTTNYDRLIEAGSELAGLHLIDRFVGLLAPVFRSTRLDIDMHYNPPGIRGEPRYLEGVARFTKLHGSIDWVSSHEDIRRIGVPFGATSINPFLSTPGLSDVGIDRLMIYPNSAKDRETTEYPYVELFRDFASALCRPNSTLFTYGYGFGDDHINRVIRDMLTIPSTHLVMVSYSDMDGRIIKKFHEFGRSSQISIILGSGLADLRTLVDYFLPKPSIDRTSLRMSELLKQRYILTKSDGEESEATQ